jgi:hypothetical protein
MDWIPALLKHLAISRSVIGAAFVTSLVLYFGPRLAPSYVDPVPKEWSFALIGTLVFSGCLLLFWACSYIWTSVKQRWSAASALFASSNLNQLEVDFLHAMGGHPSEPLNLERVNYEALSLSRLEVLEVIQGLRRKGLVSLNPFDNDLVSLTESGRARALEIQRASTKNAT